MKEYTVYFTVGAPGSGKTRWSKSIQSKYTVGYVLRTSRDDLRTTLYGDNYFKGYDDSYSKFEDVLVETQLNIIKTAIQNDSSKIYIIDNANCHIPTLDHMIKTIKSWNNDDIKITIRIQSFIHVPLSVCKYQNRDRTRIVPEDILLDIYDRMNGVEKWIIQNNL